MSREIGFLTDSWVHDVYLGKGQVFFGIWQYPQVKSTCINLEFHENKIFVCVLRDYSAILDFFILPEVKYFSKLKRL